MMIIAKFALPAVVLSILFLLITGNFFSPSPFVIAGQIGAVALSLWARRSFSAGQFSIHAEPGEGALLSSGPYKTIRHPMYAASLLLIWSSILGHPSTITLAIGIIVTGIVSVRVVVEERLLSQRFPNYAEYSARTKRIIPYLV